MLRKLGITALALVGVLLGLFVAAFAVAQTGPARDQISDLVAGTLSDDRQQAEVEQLGGLLPFDIRLGRLALRDEEGVWLEVNQARVKLSPTALVQGRFHVEEAGAARVAVNHLPPPGPPAPEPETGEPFRLPEPPQLPESLPVIRVDRLHVDRIELAEPVLGQAAVFNLEGTATTGEAGRQAQTRLALRRIDEATAALDLAASLDLAAQSLGIDLQGSETGGLMAAVTGQEQAGALRLALEGQGPLAGWQGRLLAEVERLARLETTLALAYADTPRIGIDGTFTAAPGVLPETIAPLVGEAATLALHAGETAPGVFALEQLRLEAGALRLTGTGTADVNADRLDGTAQLEVPALADLSGIAGIPLAGAARLTLDASGRVAEPALRLELGATEVAADRVTLPRLDSGFDVTLLRAPDNAIAGARINGTATAEGLAVEGRQVGEGGRASLAVDAELPPAGQIRVERLALESGLARLDLTGAVDRQTLAGQLSLEGGVPDLRSLMALLPPETTQDLPPLQGAVALDGEATLGNEADRIEARLGLTGQGLAGLPPGAQELLGDAPRIEARALIEQKQAVDLQEVRLEGAGVTLTGNPRLGLDRQLGGQVQVELSDLGRLEPLVQQAIGGRVAATAALGGTLDAPAVDLDATGEAIRFGEQAVDRLSLKARAEGPPESPAGNLDLTASRGGQDLALSTNYALADRNLRLEGLQLTGPQTRLAGELEIDLEETRASGRLAGGIEDLAALSAWHQQDLAGAIDLEAVLATPGGRQDAEVTLSVREIAGSFGRLAGASLEGSVRDALGAPAVDASATLTGFAGEGIEVSRAALSATGPLADLGLEASAAGSQAQQPFDLRAAAQAALLGESRSVLLESFGGRLAGQRIDLMAPARVTLDQGVLDLDQLDLRLGPAQIQGDLRYGNGQARGEIRLAALPLDLLEGFGAPALKGLAEGALRFDGPTGTPEAALDLALRDLQPGGAGPGTPTAELVLSARTDEAGLSTRLTAAGFGDQPLVADATLPLRLSLEPLAFDLRPEGPLAGSIQGTLDLARVAGFAALDRQLVSGRLDADLRLAGSVAQPGLDGQLTVSGGRVDDLVTGASLRDVSLVAQAAGQRLEITDLTAADPYGGRIAGRGGVALTGGMRPDFDLALNLARARLLDSDLGIAVISGDASLEGDAEGAVAEARLLVNEADLRIPDQSEVTIPELDVIVRGEEPVVAAEDGAGVYPLRLDVEVDAPARLFVRGRGLESEWGGSIRIAGKAADPEVTGRIEFRRGFLDLLGQRFDIRQGTVAFVGRDPPVPTVELEAAATTADVQAVVRLQGPIDNPRLEVTSEPELPQDEVLARVLFGRATDRITPLQGLRLAAAVRQLQGGSNGLGDVLDAVRQAAGLDTLEIQGGDGTGEASAAVGRYISDNVYLQLQRGVQPGSGRARVEVELTPNLSVGTSVTGQSQTGVDLQWRYDY